MDRTSLLWTVVLFFAASLMFALIREVTKGESVGITLGAQAAAGLVLIGAVVIYVRRRR